MRPVNKTAISPGQLKLKRTIFASILVLSSLALTLAAAELVLRHYRQSVQKWDVLDPGLIVYNRYLGWNLAPRWHGQHQNPDFKARYTTNHYGFRGRFEMRSDSSGRRYAFVGDSFTFGMGVNDDKTFVHNLNASAAPGDIYLNFAIPGFSTDQEYILINKRVFDFLPDVIVLVTYLGNDLFDNQLPFPLQANRAKPYFELSGDKLVLNNSPVPFVTKPKRQAALDINHVVMGDKLPQQGPLMRRLNNIELFKLAKRYVSQDNRDRFPLFENRFKNPLRLFTALLEHIRSACERHDTRLLLVLMPGRSLVERQGSRSAQFQEFLRLKIIELCKELHIRVLDLAGYLKQYYRENRVRLFYPNEGHMNSEGHRVTADFLRTRLESAMTENP